MRKSKRKAQDDGLLKLLSDTTLDPQTGALLGRFICEERDTGRRLKACYQALKDSTAKTTKPMADTNLDQVCEQLAMLTEKVEAMSRLKAVR